MKLDKLPINGMFQLPKASEIWQKVVAMPLKRETNYSFRCVCIRSGSAYDRGDTVPILATYDVVPTEAENEVR